MLAPGNEPKVHFFSWRKWLEQTSHVSLIKELERTGGFTLHELGREIVLAAN